MTGIAQLLRAKGERIWWVKPGVYVYDALKLMMERDVGALLVLDGGKLVGMISERDYARKVALHGRSSKATLVREVMTRDVPSVRPDQSVEEGMSLMTERRLRHLPVVEAGQVVGVISMGDLLHRMILEQESTIEELGREIAEREAKEAALRRREAEIRAILDTAVDGIVTIDAKGAVHTFNPAAASIFGYTPREVIGRNISILMPEPDRSRHDRYIADYLRTGKAKIVGRGREVVGRRKDGTTFPLYIAVGELRLGDQLRFTAILRDLSDFKRMQEEVLVAQNLAAIGEMAASVAHEIRNPVAGIRGVIEVLEETLPENDPRREVMKEVVDQIDRLNNIVQQLLILSRPWKAQTQLCDLRDLVERLTRSSRGCQVLDSVRIVFQGRRSVLAPVDPLLFEQVLWNLLQNAVDAMSECGEIRLHFGQTREFATLVVADRGAGIPRELQDRLFRPFFTTKARGTGLGLCICKKIMDAHGGGIAISSRRSRGTRVALRFPRSPTAGSSEA